MGSVGRFLVRESSPDVRTIHVHIVRHETNDWWDYVAFRDMLRADPVARKRYMEVKRALAERFAEDRKSYRAAKDDYLREIVDGLRGGAPQRRDWTAHDTKPA